MEEMNNRNSRNYQNKSKKLSKTNPIIEKNKSKK